MNFNQLHHQNIPLLICNVWDVASAKAAERLNYPAIATSSGAIASMLGYQDGEKMSFAELEYIVQRITETVDLPLSVDLEAGYSRKVDKIVNYIERLSALGIVGINLEDSLVQEKRTLADATGFAQLLETIIEQLKIKSINIYINVRTDTFLLNCENTLEETIRRAKLYEGVGANGLFVPCIVEASDIQAITAATKLPINVMCMSNLADFESLQKLGVKRISMGNFVFNKLNAQLEQELKIIKSTQSFQSLFA